jgi:UDP-glucose 4-epimerase
VKVLVTGASGFICGYLIQELLDNGYEVVGLDNFSKYGRLQKSYDSNPRYKLVEGDAKDAGLMKELLSDCDHFIAAAAMIGGISYFHEFAYDLLAENERIIASSFDAAIWAHKERKLKKILVLSSSMVFESTTEYPTPEGAERRSPPPRSTYGFPKTCGRVFCPGRFRTVQACRTPSCGLSIALALAKSAHCLTGTS